VQIDYRLSEGNVDRARKFAAELAALNPDLIVASGTAGVQPLSQATRTSWWSISRPRKHWAYNSTVLARPC
jgi:ABC-type uncharacterized transport system substrate-binding protein